MNAKSAPAQNPSQQAHTAFTHNPVAVLLPTPNCQQPHLHSYLPTHPPEPSIAVLLPTPHIERDLRPAYVLAVAPTQVQRTVQTGPSWTWGQHLQGTPAPPWISSSTDQHSSLQNDSKKAGVLAMGSLRASTCIPPLPLRYHPHADPHPTTRTTKKPAAATASKTLQSCKAQPEGGWAPRGIASTCTEKLMQHLHKCAVSSCHESLDTVVLSLYTPCVSPIHYSTQQPKFRTQ
jgi:hypothetical protein